MINMLKTLISDFHSTGIPSGIIRRDLKVPLDVPKVVSIIGPRRAGKTWYLFSLIEQLQASAGVHRIVYINFEDERLQLGIGSLGLVIDAYQQLYPDQPLDQV